MITRRKSDYVPEAQHATLTEAESLKIARELQELSQSELADLSGISQPKISAFERGREEMGIKSIKALARALKVHPSVIAFPDWEAEVVDLSVTQGKRGAANTSARAKGRLETPLITQQT